MTIKRIIVCSLGILSFALNTMAARIDTLSVESPKMKKEIQVTLIMISVLWNDNHSLCIVSSMIGPITINISIVSFVIFSFGLSSLGHPI